MMKKLLLYACAMLLLGLQTSTVLAGSIEDEIFQLPEGQLTDKATPVVNAFHGLINQGLYHNASSHGLPGFDIGVKALFLQIPTDQQTGVLASADVKALTLPVAQASIGLLKGFQVSGRFFTADLGAAGKLTLLGGGARFELNEIVDIPLLAPRFALQYFHNSLRLGDVFSANSSSYDLMVSKKLFIIEPYAGFGYSSTSIAFDYVNSLTQVAVSKTLDTSGSRLVVGFNWIPFPLLRINAEYTFLSDYPLLTGGLIISFL